MSFRTHIFRSSTLINCTSFRCYKENKAIFRRIKTLYHSETNLHTSSMNNVTIPLPVTVCSRFTAKCAMCSVPFNRSDLVMRARHLIFHVDCFRCTVCERRLTAGDEFALTPGDRLCCRADLDSADVTATTGSYDVTETGKCDATSSTTTDDDVRPVNNNNENETKTKTSVNNLSGEFY